MELLTCGRKGLRSAELKVPQLILCSERNKTTGTAKGPRKEETEKCFSPHIKSEACTVIAPLLLFSCLVYSLIYDEEKER